jgi:hypothetical protein
MDFKLKIRFKRSDHDCAEPMTWVSDWLTVIMDDVVFSKMEEILTRIFPNCEMGREDVKYGSELVVRFTSEEDEAYFIMLQNSGTLFAEI